MAEIRLQMQETPGEPSPTSTISRVKFSTICNMLAVLGLALLSGGCMGDMATAMGCFIKGATQGQTELTVTLPELYPFTTSSYVTYMSLVGAAVASGAGIACGHQVYDLVKRQSQEHLEGPEIALALAAHVAVLGVAVTGAAVGAVLESAFSSFILIPFSVGSSVAFVLLHSLVSTVWYLLCAWSGFYYGCIGAVISYVTCLSVFLEYAMAILWFSTGFVLFLDMGSVLPLVLPLLLLCMCHKFHKFQFSRTAVKIPAIMVAAVLIARSCFRDEEQPSVPFLDPADFTLPDLQVLERFFVLVLALQMFQASCGAVIFSYFVDDEATEISAGAVSFATAGVLALLMKISPMLPAGVLLGGLLAASGGAGAALIAAGDLGHRYGGHGGRAAAALIAAFGAFLPLAICDVHFGLMVALCAAAIPGSPFVEFCLDYINSLHLMWRIVMMCCALVSLLVYVQVNSLPFGNMLCGPSNSSSYVEKLFTVYCK